MREVAGAVLVLAGSVLIAAGIVADAVSGDRGGHGYTGYVLGAIVGLVGVGLLVARPLRRAWEAIPVDDLGPGARRPGNTASAPEPGGAADRAAGSR